MQDAERLRSERWNDGYFDEWTTFGKFEAFNKTIIGRVTKDNQFPDCPIRQNHIHLSSTPGFKHQPAYQIVKRIDGNIASGNQDYGRFSCNYRHIPVNEEWRWLVNRKVIFTMQTSLPQGIVKSEIDGFWQDDSMSFTVRRTLAKQDLEILLHQEQDTQKTLLFVVLTLLAAEAMLHGKTETTSLYLYTEFTAQTKQHIIA